MISRRNRLDALHGIQQIAVDVNTKILLARRSFSVAADEVKIVAPLKYLGRNSMYMLWIHTMDYAVSFVWSITGNGFINAGLRILGYILLFFGSLFFCGIRSIFYFYPIIRESHIFIHLRSLQLPCRQQKSVESLTDVSYAL